MTELIKYFFPRFIGKNCTLCLDFIEIADISIGYYKEDKFSKLVESVFSNMVGKSRWAKDVRIKGYELPKKVNYAENGRFLLETQ